MLSSIGMKLPKYDPSVDIRNHIHGVHYSISRSVSIISFVCLKMMMLNSNFKMTSLLYLLLTSLVLLINSQEYHSYIINEMIPLSSIYHRKHAINTSLNILYLNFQTQCRLLIVLELLYAAQNVHFLHKMSRPQHVCVARKYTRGHWY